MANVYAVKSGNWSDTTVWNTGALPTSADDVFSNNFTVTVDGTFTVLSIRNTSATGISAGGFFNPANGCNLTCTSTLTLSTPGFFINSNLSSGQVGTFNLDNISLSTSSNVQYIVQHASEGTFNLSLASISMSTGGFTGVSGIRNTSNGIFNLICNSISNGNINGNAQACVFNQGIGTLNINGNIGGGTGGITVQNTSSGVLNVNGTVSGGGGAAAVGNISNGIVNITGTVSSTGTNFGTINNSTGTINITGTATGGSSTGSAFANNSTGTINHIGTAQASATAAAIGQGSASQVTILTGPLLSSDASFTGASSSGVNPCIALRWFPKDTALSTFKYTMRAQSVVGIRSERNFFNTSAYSTTYPSTTNVRRNVTYGPAGIYTGTMDIPNPQTVGFGVPVGTTTGTAVLALDDIWNSSIVGIASTGSIGERLKNCATVESVAQTISNALR